MTMHHRNRNHTRSILISILLSLLLTLHFHSRYTSATEVSVDKPNQQHHPRSNSDRLVSTSPVATDESADESTVLEGNIQTSDDGADSVDPPSDPTTRSSPHLPRSHPSSPTPATPSDIDTPTPLSATIVTLDEVEPGLLAPGDYSFWTFQLVIVLALIGSVWLLRRRRRVVMSAHNRRLDHLVNS